MDQTFFKKFNTNNAENYNKKIVNQTNNFL
jgi:hypothetical protein